MSVNFQNQGLSAKVIDKSFCHFDGDVLDMVEAERGTISPVGGIVANWLGGECFILMMYKVKLTENVAIFHGNINRVQNGNSECKITSDS
jgi:hypothetical protein